MLSNTKNFLKYFALLFFSVALVSCGDDDDEPTVDEPTGSYFPFTIGSTWTYEDNEGESFTINARDETVTIDGVEWRFLSEFEQDDEFGITTAAVARIDQSTQIAYQAIVIDDGDGNRSTIAEIPFADLNADVGDTWTHDTNLFIDIRLTGRLLEKDAQRTVNGQTYENVIVVEITGETIPADPDFDIDGETYYLAPGVGIIEIVYSDGSFERLVSYDIK